MNAVLTGLVSGILVVFLAWLARAIFLSRRLFLIQPRLFDYSELLDARDTKTIELTVFNGGIRAEEDIKLQLSPAFRYTILASNTAGLAVDPQGIMRLDRLAPKQDMTVVLTAEGGEFRKDHVVGISSKDTVGKIKDSLQEAQLTPAQNVVIGLLVFGLLPSLGYFIGRFLVEDIWANVATVVAPEVHLAFDVGAPRIRNISAEKKQIQTYQESYVVDRVVRSGDLVTVFVKLKNAYSQRLSFTLSTATPVSEDRPIGANYLEADVLVFPKGEKLVSLVDYLPPHVKPQIVTLEVVVDEGDARVYFDQDVVLNELEVETKQSP